MTPEPAVVNGEARRGRLAWVFVDGERRLRSGWAILVYLLAMVGAFWLASRALYRTGLLPSPGSVPLDDVAAIPEGFVRMAVVFLPTVVGCLVVRQRLGAAYYADRRWAARVGWGLLAGIGIISGTALLAALMSSSWFSLIALPAPEVTRSVLLQIAVLVPVSFAEEILFHGFVFQQLVRGIGRIAAVAVTAILFGLMHWENPGATVYPLINIAIVGVLFGVITLRTGSLWVVSGLHVGWNVFQGAVWGSAVSGAESGASILEPTRTAETIWNGGAFGYEASVSNTVLLAIALVLAFLWPVRSNAAVESQRGSAREEEAPLLEPAEPPETTEPPPM